jgi:hypothetical protein
MAKKRRKEEVEAEKYEWKPPDFDEKSFLKTDIKGTKVLMWAALLGVLLGILAYVLTGISALLGVVVLLAGAVLLKKILPLFRVDLDGVKTTTIFGNAAILFIIGLAVWIVMLNPPFSDHYPPQITSTQIYYQHGGGNWTIATSSSIHVGDNVRVVAKVVENGHLSSVTVNIGGITSGYVDMSTSLVPGSYAYEVDNVASANTYSFSVKAVDSAGNSATANNAFIVNA